MNSREQQRDTQCGWLRWLYDCTPHRGSSYPIALCGGYNYDSTSIRLWFGRRSTSIRLKFDGATTIRRLTLLPLANLGDEARGNTCFLSFPSPAPLPFLFLPSPTYPSPISCPQQILFGGIRPQKRLARGNPRQTMVVNHCPISRLSGGLWLPHPADEDAVSWLGMQSKW